ncbi:23S rRNA (uridine(2552)-2'-O)-methyltransferase RlmE [Aliikangiella marina]|uniref:Ribosomal RNA large subunit methyltransferase E n=1 Tax=Aliikangiella marina TaxID=1712262 RepID=A0A545T9B2_9GAMM|nr:23S rRNA (uridine(2552)-2'-O)-methyltransferase RlmE [Aliikangiella marina]TQV73803.1 23S rRNA (uridine(2552)-2'-O)-methyltransferase RlmE [Aliikangiella marina]
MAKSKSSKGWLKEHFDDPYVKRSQEEGVRSRAVYKLEELDQKDKLLKPGITMVDLGAAPGGWSEYAAKKVGPKGKIIATDILHMDYLDGVEFIQGDFREDEVLDAILTAMGNDKADLVISDMAPNISGVGAIDQPASMYLVDLALDLARQILKPGGNFLVKVFQGEGFDQYKQEVNQSFKVVKVRKPKASRPRSREVYIFGQGYKG